MYKEYLELNNLQLFICNKTQPNQTKPRAWPVRYSLSVSRLFQYTGWFFDININPSSDRPRFFFLISTANKKNSLFMYELNKIIPGIIL